MTIWWWEWWLAEAYALSKALNLGRGLVFSTFPNFKLWQRWWIWSLQKCHQRINLELSEQKSTASNQDQWKYDILGLTFSDLLIQCLKTKTHYQIYSFSRSKLWETHNIKCIKTKCIILFGSGMNFPHMSIIKTT